MSLTIGLLIIYLKEQEYKHIYIYHNPDNINKYQWVDHANYCYEWQQSDILCPDDSKHINEIPLQLSLIHI